MEQVDNNRRRWLSLGGIVLGSTLLSSTVQAHLSGSKPRSLRFHNINTNEYLVSKFHNGKHFVKKELQKLNYILRDRRTGKITNMDPKLFLKIDQIQKKLALKNAEVKIICGYRTARTNAKMHRRSRGVAKQSYHIKGQAIDLRVTGVPLSRLYQAALSLHNGGVGYYPRSNFVHIDTGPVRTWRGR
ncbi:MULTISPECIES: YcbK family protein [Pasteurellaceae]|uniref:Murein endopeptidase K n=1 Tax=Pasteurella atlantica TaxID=2827233 RepID=A0AAW8CP20_9PAST|nr:YcbK family protein [Pasteurella atlantica]MBR0573799.1 YcbK family protein [Pasteurella atlantica]MDP8039735.1 YcbK family protein [Pasteurella atlantica]MDP8041920.1 YcbK family protein [Pasteurella atlantica]MDP8044055.1 YcbK family protein [Pasteurella atlantica]MDP8046033.1 YcbK family protein [Pasteurella atlantica]